MSSSKSKQAGVAIDGDAQRKHDPVTVVVSPAGNAYDADTWSDANNLLGMGYSIKDGYPTGPDPVDPTADEPAASKTPAASSTTTANGTGATAT